MEELILHVSTKKAGSEISINLKITEDDVKDMSEEEYGEIINQAIWDNLDVWVTPHIDV